MKYILEGSNAVAKTINNIKPGVVSAYPITPQTHIVEDLAQMKADGEADFEYVLAESEFAAASIVEGASATGVRVYSATSSQGLLLMTEVIYNIAGMRLPVVLTCANRAVSAPINIHNDQQDAVTMRDAGWLMFFGENNQEVCDLHILAYKVAERVKLPAMVNMDGFILTHVVEPVEIETTGKIAKFLPPFKPEVYLDPDNPMTLGPFAMPDDYYEIRKGLHQDIVASATTIKEELNNFKKIFGREIKLTEYYGDKKAQTVFVSMGSVVGTIKDTVDKINKNGKKAGVLKIGSLRPFMDDDVVRLLKGAKNIAVIDKSISLSTEGILATEIRRAFSKRQLNKNITSFIAGLGGKDIRMEDIAGVHKKAGKKNNKVIFI